MPACLREVHPISRARAGPRSGPGGRVIEALDDVVIAAGVFSHAVGQKDRASGAPAGGSDDWI